MAGLFAAEAVTLQQHLLHDEAVADLGGDEADALALAELDEAEVGHDRADDSILVELAARLHVQRADGHDHIAIDFVAVLVHHQAAVGVAIEGHAGVEAVFAHVGLEGLKVRGAAIAVDVEAVGRVGEHVRGGAEGVEKALGGAAGRTVGAVHGDVEALQRVGNGAEKVVHIVLDHLIAHVGDLADGFRRGGRGRVDLAEGVVLDALLQFVGQFHALAAEHLDAVELRRVVGGGDHDAGVGLVLGEQVGHGRRGHEAEHDDVRADGAETRRAGQSQHVRGHAAVHADDEHRAAAAVAGNDRRSGAAQAHGQVDGELFIGDAAHAVGAKQSSHA